MGGRAERRTAGWIAGLALLVSASPAVRLSAQDDVGIAVGRVPPAVTIEDLDGKPVDLASVIGKGPALIEFWATWCERCRALEPKLKAAHARHGAAVRFVAIAVAVNETRATVRRHLAQHPMPYPFLWDDGGRAVRGFQAPTTSYLVALGRDGKVVYTGVGADQDLDAALTRALAPD